MKEKSYLIISGVIFALAGLFHLLRILFQWSAMVGTWTVPFTLSLVAIIVMGVLSITAFRLSRTVVQ